MSKDKTTASNPTTKPKERKLTNEEKSQRGLEKKYIGKRIDATNLNKKGNKIVGIKKVYSEKEERHVEIQLDNGTGETHSITNLREKLK